MKRELRNWLLLFILCFSFCFPVRLVTVEASELDQVAVLKISPSTYNGVPGEIVHVSVWVENVIDLYGADVQIQFTPGALEVLDANPSLDGVQVNVRSDFLQPQMLLHRDVNNSTGTIWYTAAQIYPTEPVSGAGILFEFDMRILQFGSFPVNFSSTQLSETGGVSIVHDSQGAVFATSDCQSIFMPLVIR